MLPQTIQSFAGDRSTPTSRPRSSQPYLPFQSGRLSAPVRTLPPQNCLLSSPFNPKTSLADTFSYKEASSQIQA